MSISLSRDFYRPAALATPARIIKKGMQKKFFWLGLAVISLVLTFNFSFLMGTLLTVVAGAAWWWGVYRSGFLS